MSAHDYDDDDKKICGDDDCTSDLGSVDDPMSTNNSDDEKTVVRGDATRDTGFGSSESLATITNEQYSLDISLDSGIGMISPFDELATVDDVIKSVESINHDDYDLEYNGRVWPRGMLLRDTYIPKNGRVKVAERKIKVIVTNGSNGRKFNVDIQRSATVKALKNKMRDCITIDNPRISYNGNELNDSKTLHDYNIQKNSGLTIFNRCYGG